MNRKLAVLGGLAVFVAGLTLAFGLLRTPTASGGGSTCTATQCTWDGNGSDSASCKDAGAGTPILWIFTGDATPTDLVVTWSTGETDVITGWVQMGNGSWHLSTGLVGTFPPTSAYVDFTGTLGNGGATLTISGCNEGGPPGTTTTTTTPTTTTETTTTGQTTTTGETTTVTVPSTTTVTTPGGTTTVTTPGGTTTVTTPGGTTTVTTPSPPKHHKPHKPKIPKHPHPTNTE
jgi:hypothetical protein